MGEYLRGDEVAAVAVCTLVGVAAVAGVAMLGDWLDHLHDYKETGIVHLGADGHEYVLPEGAERPVYSSLDACMADVSAQIKAIQTATGDKVQETPKQLCEPADDYPIRAYPRGYVYGPIVNKESVWQSKGVKIWETTIADGSFGDPGYVPNYLELAPQDVHVGDHITLSDPAHGGFGEHGSGGFSKNGGAVREGGFGGGGGEHGSGGEHGGFHGGGGHGGK